VLIAHNGVAQAVEAYEFTMGQYRSERNTRREKGCMILESHHILYIRGEERSMGRSAAGAAVGVAEAKQVSLRVASPIFILAPGGKRKPWDHATSAMPC